MEAGIDREKDARGDLEVTMKGSYQPIVQQLRLALSKSSLVLPMAVLQNAYHVVKEPLLTRMSQDEENVRCAPEGIRIS